MNNTYIKRLTVLICFIFFFSSVALCAAAGPRPNKGKNRAKNRTSATYRRNPSRNLFVSKTKNHADKPQLPNTEKLVSTTVIDKTSPEATRPLLTISNLAEAQTEPATTELYDWTQHPSSYIWEKYGEISKEVSDGTFGQVTPIKLSPRVAFEQTDWWNPVVASGNLVQQAEQAAELYKNSMERLAVEGERAATLYYQREINIARRFRNHLESIDAITDTERPAIKQYIEQVQSPALRRQLTLAAEEGNLKLMRQDLVEYYDLEDVPTESAYNYLLRTGKQSLFVRKAIHSPLVDMALKNRLEHFLNEEELTLKDEVLLRYTLEVVDRQIKERIAQATEAKDAYAAQKNRLQEQRIKYNQDFVRSVTKRVAEFAAREGRLPQTNGEEFPLASQLSWIRFAGPKDTFNEDAAEQIKELEALCRQYEWTREKTLQRYHEWEKAHPGQIVKYGSEVSEEENELFSALVLHNLIGSGGQILE